MINGCIDHDSSQLAGKGKVWGIPFDLRKNLKEPII
jgi:hypothetical protein